MAILGIPVWPFEPNWSGSLTETLEWLTDVMVSPTGSEQRRALRVSPRRTYEYGVVTEGSERQLFDNMLISFGTSMWYMPLWHEVDFLTDTAAAGTSFIPCDTSVMRMDEGSVVYLTEGDVYTGELAEVSSVLPGGLNLVAPLSFGWTTETRIYEAVKTRLTDQPSKKKSTDGLTSQQVRFLMVEPSAPFVDGTDNGLQDIYRGFYVLAEAPDEADDFTDTYERMLVELDVKVALPRWRDTAQRAFTVQQYSWFLDGRDEHRRFERFACALRGRAIPIWIPTFMQDMLLSADIGAADPSIRVDRCGFTQSGGPRGDRQDIMIETHTERFYRRITNAGFDSDMKEVLVLDTPLGQHVAREDIVRISFMTLARLNQDNIQIEHQTDTHGSATVTAMFRSAPDSRVPAPGF